MGGNGLAATQGTSSKQPQFLTSQINGNPSVHFDGTNDYLGIASNNEINQGGPHTQRSFFVVVRTGSDVSTRQVVYEEGGGTRGLVMYIYNGDLYFGGWDLANDGSGSLWGFSFTNTPISANSTYILSFIYNGNATNTGTIQGFLNGYLFGTIPNVGELYDHNPAILGAEISGSYYETGASNTDGNYFSGDIAEFILYNMVVNAAQRIIIENYLSAKYNITLGTNDVYTMDDPGNGNFDYEVAGIGQVDAANKNTDAQGTSDVRILNPSGLDDGEYLI